MHLFLPPHSPQFIKFQGTRGTILSNLSTKRRIPISMSTTKRQSFSSSSSSSSTSSSSFHVALFLTALLGLLLLLLVPAHAFEFDIPNEAARQFGPSQGGPAAAQRALLFADPEANMEDTAGFVSGLPVSARRRLIQPPPLKRAAMEAQRMDWLLAGLRPRAD